MPDRKPELDGLRGLAILLVLIWHYVNRQIEPHGNSILAYVKLATDATWSGVDLFFVLSGFLIGGILLDRRTCSNYFSVFYIRRACRILPLYLALVFIFLALSNHSSSAYAWLFEGALPTWSYFTFTQNYLVHSFEGHAHWLGITWSLAVEEQFYLFLPVLIWFASPPWLVVVLVSFVAGAPLMRFWVGGVGSFTYTFCRTDSLLIGVLLAWFYQNPSWVEFLRRKRAACSWLLTIMILLTTLVPLMAYSLGGVGNHFWFALLYGVLLIYLAVFPESGLANAACAKWLVWLGMRSYFIYLAHQAVSGVLHGAIFSAAPGFSSPQEFTVTVMALAVVLVLASLSYRYFELPFLSFGRRFSYRQRTETFPPNSANTLAGDH